MNNVIIILFGAFITASIVIMNVYAVKGIRRILSVKDGAEITKGTIVAYDHVDSLKVEYTVGGINYSGKCGILFLKDRSPKVISVGSTVQYAVGDVVDVRYNILEPSKFLIAGGKEYYKAKAVQIFVLDAGVIGIAAICLVMHFCLGL